MSFANVGTTNAGTFTMQGASGAGAVPVMDAAGIATGGAFLVLSLIHI